jgi:hypothetical protein
MSERYFTKFPRINYNGVQAVDITKRVNLLNKVKDNPFVFYIYDVPEGQRADQVAEAYYNDPYMSWLVYLSNQTVDPYYQWQLSSNEFDAYLIKKYGSIENAQEKIAFYRNNWFDTDPITVERYNALSVNELKYYDPVFGSRNEVTSYTRRKFDWTLGTNAIVRYTGNFTPGFIVDEIVDIDLTGPTFGRAQVAFVGDTYVDLQHISGVYLTSNTVVLSGSSTITGRESGSTGVVTAVTLLANNLQPEEVVYWDAVTWYDVETEKNASHRSIRLLDSKFAPQTTLEFKTLMKK